MTPRERDDLRASLDVTTAELSESWINGNHKYVVEQLKKAPSKLHAAFAAVEICRDLSKAEAFIFARDLFRSISE